MLETQILMLMKRQPFRTVLRRLAETDPDQFIKPNGELNQSAMARVLRCRQSAVSRMLKNPNHYPSKATIDATREYFGVSAAEARGESTLAAPPDKRYSARTRGFADRFEHLEAHQKKALEDLLQAFIQPSETRRRA